MAVMNMAANVDLKLTIKRFNSMPGVLKIPRNGRTYIKDLYAKYPNALLHDLRKMYNEKASKEMWLPIRSDSTVRNYLVRIGIYEKRESKPLTSLEKRSFIKLDVKKTRELSKIKGVSLQSVYSALKFQTRTKFAMDIRSWALSNGGKLYIEEESKNTVVK